MFSIRSILPVLALGLLGAVLSVSLLLIVPSGEKSMEYSQLAGQQLPVLVLVASAGFSIGGLIAITWSIVQRLLAPASARTGSIIEKAKKAAALG
jgi:hypothetical protein